MIRLLRGVVVEKDEDSCVIDTGGVGYGVFAPSSTLESLPEPGQEATLHIHTHVREDQISLYGFLRARERDVFEAALGASGVGPRMALAMLSRLSVEQLADAVVTSDLAVLSSVPGVGKKRAEKLALELRGRLSAYAGASEEGRAGGDLAPATDAQREAIEALIGLGATAIEARNLVQSALREVGAEADLQSLVEAAMRKR